MTFTSPPPTQSRKPLSLITRDCQHRKLTLHLGQGIQVQGTLQAETNPLPLKTAVHFQELGQDLREGEGDWKVQADFGKVKLKAETAPVL